MLGIGVLAQGPLFSSQERVRRSRWDLIFNTVDTIPAPFRPDPASWDPSTMTAAWIGHSTVLINMFGTMIITDPVFSSRIGINVFDVLKIGPKRLVDPALTLDELPPIDLLLLSHGHMDHLDLPTLKHFRRDTPLVLAKGTSDIVHQLKFSHGREIDWDEKIRVAGVEIEALRVRHFGWRFPWENDRSRGYPGARSYNAYLIMKNGRSILFGGDTAYQEYFIPLRGRTTPIDLAILPIGAYDPWIFSHASPEQALAMADHMNARQLMPVHWNTFILSDEPVYEPIKRLKKATAGNPERLALEAIGQTWTRKDGEGRA